MAEEELPLAYTDPHAYLAQSIFHRSLSFRPSWLAPTDAPHRVTFATVGDPKGPLIFMLNGLGGHRLFGAMLHGIALDHSAHVITLDRPSCGGSTPVPLSQRVQWSHESILAIHAALSLPITFSLLSHSNGVIYALYTLLHLPPHLKVRRWDITSPWVPTFISHSIPFRAATFIPASATSKLGPIVSSLMKTFDPIGKALGWSSGLLPGRSKDSLNEREVYLRKNKDEPREKHTWGRKYFSQKTEDLGFSYVLAEGLDAMGLEALICLRKGGGEEWGWGMNGEEKDREGVMRRGFGELKAKLELEDARTEMCVFYGTDDGMVPAAGRKHMKEVLVDELGLVKVEDWVELKGVGHDVPLMLTVVMETIFTRVDSQDDSL
ncbi:hypothetical protein P7C70_g6392, partial [Phenoliferia sp. Uapishka_3]